MDTLPQEKCCRKCNTVKPRSSFSPSKQNLDGLFSYCRDCRKAYGAARYAANPERYQAQFAAWRDKNLEHDRARARRYYADHQDERTAYRRNHYADDSRSQLEASRLWRKANPHIRRLQAARYRMSHPDTYRETIKRWKARNPDKVRKFGRLYRARKMDAVGCFTDQEWRDLCERYGNVCLACGESSPLTADHVIPLSRGGSDSIDNLQPLCRECNSRKRTQTTDYRPLHE